MNMERKNRKASIVQTDLLAETVYDPILKTTSFIVYQFGKTKHADSITTESGEEIFPLDAKSDIISKGVVLFPSIYREYGTDADLLQEIQAFIHKRLDISPAFERIATQYVLLTWIFDRLNELPYLRARGDYGSGKSRFLQVIGSLCYRPIFTAGATTTSPIFRILDQVRGTLILDEADFNFSDSKHDLVKILNTGFQKGTAVLRSEGKGIFEVRSYDVFGPKLVATRQNFDDHALESRFLIEDMGRLRLREDIPIRMDDSFKNEALELRNKLLLWRFHNYRNSLVFDEKPIEGLHPRLQQIIGPLLAIMPNPEIRETLLAHAHRYNEELIADRSQSWESEIILAILRLKEHSQLDGLTVKEIKEEVNKEMDFNETLTAKKDGWGMRAKLQLKTQRTNKGFTLSLSKNNDRLEIWKDRLGITDEAIKGE